MKRDFLNLSTVKRDGTVVPFDPSKIQVAVSKAFLEVQGTTESASVVEAASRVTDAVCIALARGERAAVHIEDIQDQVELNLMRLGYLDVAKSYILFRARRAESRQVDAPIQESAVVTIDGTEVTFALLRDRVAQQLGTLACDPEAVARHAMRDLYSGCSDADVRRALSGACKVRIETDPDYSKLAARILLQDVYAEASGRQLSGSTNSDAIVREAFASGIRVGIGADILSPSLADFDLERLKAALRPERDMQLDLLGLQTLYDRYFVHVEGRRIETPQAFFMRVAMGLALLERDREGRAIEFYEVLSSFDFMSSTPTLFNSGLKVSQLSSCYLTTVPDELEGIYDAIKENALLQKFAGGLGNDWTRVRALGSHIKGTNGDSQGVVPFMKVANDTAVAVNQGGKRQGAVCAYLEAWHLDVESFLELRKNTGDDRRRTHDMSTANWIPDLFMKRVQMDGEWTLFSPVEVSDLHDLFGQEFDLAYESYEASAARGEMRQFKTIKAKDLWRKMLTMLFETGHPWITFKDACNVRSPQKHVGVVHSSNLCTEITLNTSDTETAVCNLGSVNLANHVRPESGLDTDKLWRTVRTAMRMLDNVIDINYYGSDKARRSNLMHRPVGLGVMGFQDALYTLKTPYGSDQAVRFADQWQEAICYFAYLASSYLAFERGSYESFEGSLWQQGYLPLDTIGMLASSRQLDVQVNRDSTLDWDGLREKIKRDGMRNSNCVAIAPTATIANIVGVTASTEPMFGNLAVKSNLAGEFTVVNGYLVRDLKELGLWDAAMLLDLKHFDGSVQPIDRVPDHLKALYKTAFEVDPQWLIEGAAVRQKWIDQAQSLNIYLAQPSGKKLDEIYQTAWAKGLKTTYYLRTKSAANAEKSTVDRSTHNAVAPATDVKVCRLDDPTCESCQ